ncbi:MAG: ABC transporter permease subunit [bacterium]|nr:ABC transporter permease subunit [bacterium]
MSSHEADPRDAGRRDLEIRRLYRARPRSRFARWSGAALVLLVALAWSSSELRFGDYFSERRMANLERFLGELRPYPLQGKDFDLSVAASWAGEVLRGKGWAAAGVTLAMSVAAIVLAALGALALTLYAARTLASPEPYLPAPRPPSRARLWTWRAVVALSRALLIFVRSIPEYVWAFIFLAVLGPTAWPVVLALAVHNSGILGKLTAEVVENLDPEPLAALRGLGASRMQIAAAGLFPLILPRFLLYFFYRWETCVREATVLGMLGIVSLGYWIVDARARNHYDEMFFFVLIGAGIVLVGDLVSAVAREVIRRAA